MDSQQLYKFSSEEQGGRAVGEGKATFNSIMSCGALTDEQKLEFRKWAEEAKLGDKNQIGDIKFTLLGIG